MMTLLHVFFGTLALVIAPVAVCLPKGKRWHRRCGRAFVFAMAVVLLSAGFLWQAVGHEFLVPLSAVTAYLLFSGYRAVVRQRRSPPDPFQDAVDRLAAGAVVAAALGLTYLAATAASPLMLTLRPPLIGIAAVAIAFASNDVLGFTAPRHPAGWLLAHFSGMIAAYIAAVTAFVVINAHGAPMLLRWLVPSAIGGATIVAYTLRSARLRLPRRRPRAAGPPVATATTAEGRFVLH